MAKRRIRSIGTVLPCVCGTNLAIVQENNILFGGVCVVGDWFMVRNAVWRLGQKAGACCFLCVECLEERIGRKLTAADFMRTAPVNFEGHKSAKLRHRMRGLKPAKRMIQTRFTV
jgi:hypothetical protein